MQLAVKYYKDMGGTYSGKKSSDNKLSKWSKKTGRPVKIREEKMTEALYQEWKTENRLCSSKHAWNAKNLLLAICGWQAKLLLDLLMKGPVYEGRRDCHQRRVLQRILLSMLVRWLRQSNS